MRTRARLIEVLESVNRGLLGYSTWALCDCLAGLLNGEAVANPEEAIRGARIVAAEHASPHLRDLATEALYYVREDAAKDDNTGIEAWAQMRAFELHEHETNAIKLGAIAPLFDMEGSSEAETNAAIAEFHRRVDATAAALVTAYNMGRDGPTHDKVPEARG